ncbi:MAG: hypothetical protein IAF08_16150, partial [Rhizobacter sp.]|nr:hypothetical protein [Chlorobiales bacterium]
MTQKFSCPAMLFWIAMLMLPLAARSQVVTTNADSGPGSLRDAIIFANANPGATITFSFADTAVQTITLLSDLPDIFGDGTVIDGYT